MYTDAGYDGCLGQAQGSRGYYQKDVDTFAAWGYDAIKYDNCGAFTLDAKAIYAEISAAVARSPRPMLLALCHPLNANESWEYGPYISHSYRTNGDITTLPWQTAWGARRRGSAWSVAPDVNTAHPGRTAPITEHPDNPQIGILSVGRRGPGDQSWR
jgi:hypothetical protein